MVEEKIVEEKGTTLNIVVGLGGNGTLLVDRFARSLRFKPADLLIYACDTHDKCPEVGGKTHEFVEYIPWDPPTEKQVRKLGVSVDENHVREVRQGGEEGVLRYRDYSRAAFYLNRDDVFRRIDEGVSEIRNRLRIKQLKFTLLTPLGGGTGSGSLIDFAEEIKRYFAKYGECIIDAFLVLPYGFIMRDERGTIRDLTKDEERPAFYNTFAALLEMREIIGDESRNPFHAINLISSYTLGGFDTTDSVVVRFLHDLFGNKLGEIGNIFRGMDSKNGFITMIPAIVEFPIDLIQDYISISADIKKLEDDKTNKEGALDRYTNRKGEDEKQHGSLIRAIRNLKHEVSSATSISTEIDNLQQAHLVPFKALRLHNKKVELKEIYEKIFGTDRNKWDELVTEYSKIEDNRVKLTDENFIRGIGMTKTFLTDGRHKGVDTGDIILESGTPGLLAPLIGEYHNAWKIKGEIDSLHRQIEDKEQEKRTMASFWGWIL